jgi:hypothetical protein
VAKVVVFTEMMDLMVDLVVEVEVMIVVVQV